MSVRYWVLCLFFFLNYTIYAQEKRATVGLVFRPIIPNNVFRTKTVFTDQHFDIQMNVENRWSYSYGMLVRKGLSKNWAIEGGLFQTQRNLRIQYTTIADTGFEYFTIAGFEIPIMALLYVRVSDQIYVNMSSGINFNFFPSQSGDKSLKLEYLAAKNSWLQFSSMTSVGVEWRTPNSGYFYTGISFAAYFKPIYDAQIKPVGSYFSDPFYYTIAGNYASIDLKYFFPEDKKGK